LASLEPVHGVHEAAGGVTESLGKLTLERSHTNGRGTEQLSYTFSLIDILPWGRQEEWQDSPDGWPKSPTYSNWLDSSDAARLYRPDGDPDAGSQDVRVPSNVES